MLQHILCKCVVCMKEPSISRSASWLLSRNTAKRVCKITISFMHFFLMPARAFLGTPGIYTHSFPMLVRSEHVRPSYPQIPVLYSTSTWLNRSPKSLEETGRNCSYRLQPRWDQDHAEDSCPLLHREDPKGGYYSTAVTALCFSKG